MAYSPLFNIGDKESPYSNLATCFPSLNCSNAVFASLTTLSYYDEKSPSFREGMNHHHYFFYKDTIFFLKNKIF